MYAAFHFFTFVWVHHHYFHDLLGFLRWEYPGMPGSWYTQYAHWLLHTFGTGQGLLTAVRPY
jgi:hypothetical protein